MLKSLRSKPFLINLIICFITLFLLMGNKLLPFQVSEKKISNRQYTAVKDYLKAAKASSESGAIYALPAGSRFRLYTPGKNDPGYPALVGLVSIMGWDIKNHKDLANLNLVILYASMFLLLFSVWINHKNSRFTVLLFFWLAVAIKAGLHKGTVRLVDHHGLVPALVIFTFAIALQLLKKSHLKVKILKVIGFGFLVSIVTLLRGSVGMVLTAALMASLVIENISFVSIKQDWKKVATGLSFALLFFVISKVSFNLIQRAYTYQSVTAMGIEAPAKFEAKDHGAWHNLYIGLGVFPNAWNIKWSDLVAAEHAKKVDPDVKYQSSEYFLILKREYLRYLKENPGEYILNHGKKVILILKNTWIELSLLIVLFIFSQAYPLKAKLGVSEVTLGRLWPSFVLILLALASIPFLTTLQFILGLKTAFILCVFLMPFSTNHLNWLSAKSLKSKLFNDKQQKN